MQEGTSNPIEAIRSTKRNDLKDVRNRLKENYLFHRRLRFQEVSEYVYDVTLPEFKELLLNLNWKKVSLEVLRKIKSSCISYDYIEAFCRSDGSFNSLIRILIGSNAQKQLEATACLTNIACGSHKSSYKVAKASGAYLVSFINGCSYYLQDQSAWTVANIANDCLECFNVIKSQGVLPALFKAVESPVPSVVQSVIFALNACTQYDDPEVVNLIQLGLPKHLFHVMMQQISNRSIFLDAAFTLSNCCFLIAKYSLDILDLDAVPTIINILNNITERKDGEDILVATPLVRCLGFLSCNKELCKIIFCHIDFHKSIQTIFAAKNIYTLKQEIIWVLSNIAASGIVLDEEHLLSVIDYMTPVLQVRNSSITLQVLYFLTCLASKNPSIISLLHHNTVIIPQICCLLESEESDLCQAVEVFLKVSEDKSGIMMKNC